MSIDLDELRLIGSIREMLIIEHQTWFFEGDIWHVLKDMDKESE